jgi:tRNA1Val (adenine37-N6)-methyltransferase
MVQNCTKAFDQLDFSGDRSLCVDSLLLAEFVTLAPGERIVELGTGSGVVAICLASREEVQVIGVEIQSSMLARAENNLQGNQVRLKGEVRLVEGDIRQIDAVLPRGEYDIVVSNPPYYQRGAGRLPPSKEKAVARHEINVQLDEIVSAAAQLLCTRGAFYLIHIPSRLDELLIACAKATLVPKTLCPVYTKKGAAAERILFKAVKQGRPGFEILPPKVL